MIYQLMLLFCIAGSLEGVQGLHSDRPFLVVVPNNLIDQWTVEFRRYLNEAILDVYPLTGSTGGRAKSQSDWFATSNTPAHRRVVIATHSVSLEMNAPD